MTAGQSRALRAAGIYLSSAAFSFARLREQLIFDGFSADDAEYALSLCGADWREQALRCADSYLSLTPFSLSGLRAQLLFERFTEEECAYALEACQADWNVQALRAARQYLSSPEAAFTQESLCLRLLSDGFTDSQSRYGAGAAFCPDAPTGR